MTLMSPAWGLQLSDHRSDKLVPWHPSLPGCNQERGNARDCRTHRHDTCHRSQSRLRRESQPRAGHHLHPARRPTPSPSKSPWPRPRRQAPLVQGDPDLRSSRAFGLSLAHPLSGDDRRRVVLGSRWRAHSLQPGHHWTRCSRRRCGGGETHRGAPHRGGSIGYRRASWLLQELFRVQTSKSTLSRWVKDVAAQLPSREEIVRLLDAEKPITEAHFDEIFPKGAKGPVLVMKDEHGRIVTSERIEARDEEHVKKFLQWFQGLGLGVKTFFIDCCQVYRKVIPEVFTEAKVQLDYFHVLQNVWRHMWKGFVRHRKQVASRAEKAGAPWYKAQLTALASCLWEHRYVIFKGEEELTPLDRDMLVGICEADQEVGKIRSFLSGLWHIFEDSKDEKEARRALEALKRMDAAKAVKSRQAKAVKFLEETFEESTTYLRGEAPRRNSLAESGMRTLRRLEAEHDGFRTEDSRQDFLRIYQAVKYLGWSAQGPLSPPSARGP